MIDYGEQLNYQIIGKMYCLKYVYASKESLVGSDDPSLVNDMVHGRRSSLWLFLLWKKGWRRRRTDWPFTFISASRLSGTAHLHLALPTTPPPPHNPPSSRCWPTSTFFFAHNLQAKRRMSDDVSVGTSFLLHFSRILTVVREMSCQRAIGRGRRCACHLCKVEHRVWSRFLRRWFAS